MAGEKSYLDANVRYDMDGISDDGDDNRGHNNIHHPASSSYPRFSSRPLIDYIRNEWKTNKYGHVLSRSKSPSADHPRGIEMFLSIIAAPRFRRYILVYCVMLFICWSSWTGFISPRLKEHAELMESLDLHTMEAAGGWFGTNSLPRFTDMVNMRSLDSSTLPGDQALSADDPNRKRLVVVGDVNGCKDERKHPVPASSYFPSSPPPQLLSHFTLPNHHPSKLVDQLLNKVSFDSKKGDHLIFTGDMISYSDKSPSVVDIGRQHHASCVRGTHEDRVLLVRRQMVTSNMVHLAGPTESIHGGQDWDQMDEESFSQGDYKDRTLAARLSDDQADWLDTCPAILKVGQIKGMGEVVVVHGGLVPGIELESQDPSSVMTMRTIDLKTHVPSALEMENSVSWFKVRLYSSYLHLSPHRNASMPFVVLQCLATPPNPPNLLTFISSSSINTNPSSFLPSKRLPPATFLQRPGLQRLSMAIAPTLPLISTNIPKVSIPDATAAGNCLLWSSATVVGRRSCK